jgi:hypothetical protein
MLKPIGAFGVIMYQHEKPTPLSCASMSNEKPKPEIMRSTLLSCASMMHE